MFKTIVFEVIGAQPLGCESCEQRVERLLKAVQGVRQVRAQARNQTIEVLSDTAVLEATVIAEHLANAGYETRALDSQSPGSGNREEVAETGTLADVALLVPNMVCEGCAEKISAALSSVPGVREVKPKVRQKQVYVQYEPGRVQKEFLKETIAKAGFTAVEA